VALFEKCVFRYIVFVPVGDVLSILCNFLFHVIIIIITIIIIIIIIIILITTIFFISVFFLSFYCADKLAKGC